MLDDATEAHHRKEARRFRRLASHTADRRLRELLSTIADLHERVAERLAALKLRGKD